MYGIKIKHPTCSVWQALNSLYCPELRAFWLAKKAERAQDEQHKCRVADTDVNRDFLRTFWSNSRTCHHKKQTLKWLSTQISLFKTAWRNSFLGKPKLQFFKLSIINMFLKIVLFLWNCLLSIKFLYTKLNDFVSLRCKLHMLERKCSTGVEKLKALIGEHLQNGIPVSDILEKTKSLLTLRKALLSHNGYSKYSRDILRLFPEEEDDLAPLCF